MVQYGTNTAQYTLACMLDSQRSSGYQRSIRPTSIDLAVLLTNTCWLAQLHALSAQANSHQGLGGSSRWSNGPNPSHSRGGKFKPLTAAFTAVFICTPRIRSLKPCQNPKHTRAHPVALGANKLGSSRASVGICLPGLAQSLQGVPFNKTQRGNDHGVRDTAAVHSGKHLFRRVVLSHSFTMQ